MTREDKHTEILRLSSYATKYADDVLRNWKGRLPATLTRDDLRQHALLVVCEFVEKEHDARLLKNAVVWSVRDLLRHGSRVFRNAAPFEPDERLDGCLFVNAAPSPAAVAETNDEVRRLRRAVFRVSHRLPFFCRAAIRASLLHDDADAWKYSTSRRKTFITRRWLVMKELKTMLKES